MATEPLGHVFPVGGPVPSEWVVGRTEEIAALHQRLTERIPTLLSGPRRIGKSTVCEAAIRRFAADGATVVSIEVPERADSGALLQLIVDRCSRISLEATGRRALRAAAPLIDQILKEEGIPLDLSSLAVEPDDLPTRTVLGLPAKLAGRHRGPTVFYLDELQRVVDYVDGPRVLGDLVDLYSGHPDCVVLVDGSDERALEGMLGAPIHFGKLCDRVPLSPGIHESIWRESLPRHFARTGLRIAPDALEALIRFGAGRPYATMLASRCGALAAKRLGSACVEAFEATSGIDEAKRLLAEDA